MMECPDHQFAIEVVPPGNSCISNWVVVEWPFVRPSVHLFVKSNSSFIICNVRVF